MNVRSSRFLADDRRIQSGAVGASEARGRVAGLTAGAPVGLALLDGFECTLDGCAVDIGASSQRFLAFLAIQGGRASRALVLATLWPDSDERRAAGNLRSARWRLPQPVRDALVSHAGWLSFTPDVECDVVHLSARATRLINGTPEPGDLAVAPLLVDLLPTWYDDWVAVERERLRQMRMHALEALCSRLTLALRFGDAVEAGLAAVAAEPLRETAHRRLIEAHLAEGNPSEALRQYEEYSKLLADQLGLEPSTDIAKFMRDAIGRR